MEVAPVEFVLLAALPLVLDRPLHGIVGLPRPTHYRHRQRRQVTILLTVDRHEPRTLTQKRKTRRYQRLSVS
jgi:hypothetical protein